MADDKKEQLVNLAEEGLVSSLLFLPKHVNEVLGLVVPEDFVDGRLGTIFKIIMALAENGDTIEVANVFAYMNAHGLSKQVGGVNEVIRLYNQGAINGSQASIESYTKIIREASSQRNVRKALEAGLKSLDSGTPSRNVMSVTQQAINDNMLRFSSTAAAVNISEWKDDYLKIVEERRQKFIETGGDLLSAAGGIPTGMKTIDKHVGGLMAGQMITIGGRTGIGKSFAAVGMAVAAASAGKTVMFFSLEMPYDEVMNRFVSYIAGVKLSKLINGSITDDEMDKILQAQDTISKLNIIIDSTPNVDVDYIKASAMKQQASPIGLGLVIVDYLQLITPKPSSRGDNRERQVADMSRSLKLMAMQLKIPVIDLVQLNREKKDDEDPTPTISDIRESNAIAQDSSVIILIHRNLKADGGQGDALFIIGKNRNGKSGIRFQCHTMLSYSKFVEVNQDGSELELEDSSESKVEDGQIVDKNPQAISAEQFRADNSEGESIDDIYADDDELKDVSEAIDEDLGF